MGQIRVKLVERFLKIDVVLPERIVSIKNQLETGHSDVSL
jgi:hypothetical protein